MFLGTYEHTVDAKGRLFIPAKLRDGAAEGNGKYVLTRGLEECLYLYEAKAFHETVSARLSNMSVKNQADGRAFKRLLLAGAHDIEIDEMGRILISRPHLEYAGLKKDVVILGVGERIELWSAERWAKYSAKASVTFQKMGKEFEI